MRLTDRALAAQLKDHPLILELIRQQRVALKECVDENLKLREYERLWKQSQAACREQQSAISKLHKRIELLTRCNLTRGEAL